MDASSFGFDAVSIGIFFLCWGWGSKVFGFDLDTFVFFFTNFIPHFGQLPGLLERTSGSIVQVYTVGSAGGGAGFCPKPNCPATVNRANKRFLYVIFGVVI